MITEFFAWALSFFKPKRLVYGGTYKVLNLQPDPIDPRDHSVPELPVTALPGTVDFSQFVPPVKCQGSIGSCGSHTWITAFETMMNMQGDKKYIAGSELAHYYMVRSADFMNTLPSDSGQYLRDGGKVLHQVGMVPESLWPYNTLKYNDNPSLLSRSFARFWKIKSYNRCWSVPAMRTALASGSPVIFGFRVWTEFMNDRDGSISYPEIFNERGGHAVLIVGYRHGEFLVVNSWCKSWGNYGYSWVSEEAIRKTMFDAWTMEI